MKQYQGVMTEHGGVVTVDDGGESRGLDPKHEVRRHSPAGYGWGYAGSGPAQLALALCADALGDDARAAAVYQGFQFRVVEALPADGWVLSERAVLDAVYALERERAARHPEPDPVPTPDARPTPLTRGLDAHLADLTAYRPADTTDREAVQREAGWMEAVRHLAARDGLTHAGRVEAGHLLAASRDWLREQGGGPAPAPGR